LDRSANGHDTAHLPHNIAVCLSIYLNKLTTAESQNLVEDGQPVSIAVAERETGLGKDTLRVWERRSFVSA
jgi:hypothetical protein